MVVESGFPITSKDSEREGKSDHSMEGGGSCMIYWPRGRGLRRAWALKQGNRVIDHSKKPKQKPVYLF